MKLHRFPILWQIIHLQPKGIAVVVDFVTAVLVIAAAIAVLFLVPHPVTIIRQFNLAAGASISCMLPMVDLLFVPLSPSFLYFHRSVYPQFNSHPRGKPR